MDYFIKCINVLIKKTCFFLYFMKKEKVCHKHNADKIQREENTPKGETERERERKNLHIFQKAADEIILLWIYFILLIFTLILS